MDIFLRPPFEAVLLRSMGFFCLFPQEISVFRICISSEFLVEMWCEVVLLSVISNSGFGVFQNSGSDRKDM